MPAQPVARWGAIAEVTDVVANCYSAATAELSLPEELPQMMASKPPNQLNSRFTLVLTRYLSRAHTVVYRITRGRFGGNLRVGAGFRKPAPTLLLEHRGRKSGKRFTSPVLYITDGPNVIIAPPPGDEMNIRSGTATYSPIPRPTSRSEPIAVLSPRFRPTRTNGHAYGPGWWPPTPTSTRTKPGPPARSPSWFFSRADPIHLGCSGTSGVTWTGAGLVVEPGGAGRRVRRGDGKPAQAAWSSARRGRG